MRPYGTGWDTSASVQRVAALDRGSLLKDLKETKIAFAFISSSGCPVGAYARWAFISVAASLKDRATFVENDPDRYKHFKGEVSPTILLIREGKVVHSIEGLSLPDGRGSPQVRARLLYEAFVTANLFGIDIAKDFRIPASAESLSTRPGKVWLYNYLPDGDLRFSGRDLKRMVSFNSDMTRADFRDADLRYARILFSDLRGARFDGAKLEGVEWTGSICPDGYSVALSTDSCEDHLRLPHLAPRKATGEREDE